MDQDREPAFIERILRQSGALILQSFGRQVHSKRKDDRSQIVTDLDIASEQLLIAAITKQYPKSSIVAEESGFVERDLNDVWIIDPIDGTSNFASGIPWFGVMVAHVVRSTAVSSGIYLPVSDEMYLASRGEGAWKNGKALRVSGHTNLSDVLVAYGTDGSEKSYPLRVKGDLFQALLPKVLNLRCTNSAVDYVYAAEGKLGGLINLENRIWDVAPIIPIAQEAGCTVSDVTGASIDLQVDRHSVAKNFTLLLASPSLHASLLRVINEEIVLSQ